jgi:hypothetical protein
MAETGSLACSSLYFAPNAPDEQLSTLSMIIH